MRIRVIGAGVAGLAAAFEFARAGCEVLLIERREGPGLGCSHLAGGMIAPWCEAGEGADPCVVDLGVESLRFWTETAPLAVAQGSLVVAPARDQPELARFARRTSGFQNLDAAGVAALEPDLSGRFEQALFFPQEAHLDPRAALASLAARLVECANVALRFGVDADPLTGKADWTIDCRGFDARDALPELRGVKGEMLVLATSEVTLARPVRMLHPRHPVYIVPRGDGRFMIGATMIENDEPGRVTARGMLELLGAAYAVHPAFAEAEIIETGAGVRPAFPDNLPRLRVKDRVMSINGFYRHGFLLAPALARRAVEVALQGAYFPEVMDADQDQRRSA
ncbi:glycine oxidase ThiO [Methylocapsa acidiphila]|uniref:glycine oxidase ThiO n=1 Tax=Methylocapsa acidiphila TaxID=133552 RepID=UPI00040AC4EB|nr:glycine oxidase ThiO [Methylocapsa acidiphila]